MTTDSNEERLRIVVEAAPAAMIMVDQTGKITLINSQVEILFGYSREELLGQSIEILVPESFRSAHSTYRDHFFDDPKTRSMGAGRDLYGLRKDGSEIPVEIGLNPLRAGGQRFVLASILDITERKRGEDLLNQKLIELQRSNEDLQQFAYVCSHDLQEPLRVISNYTQLLAKRYGGKVLDENAAEFMDFIVDATKRMQELINDLLVYSRVETRGDDINDCDFGAVLDMALANLEAAIQESGATVHVGYLPSVKGDSSQLLQLAQNLIGNAIKFRSEKAPEIHVAAEEDGNFWHFMVRDNGIGFDMKYAERIFVIFQRLHTKESYPGSGIGLSICKKIVERHGGRLWVESEPDAGSTFNFTIPRQKSSR